MMTDEEFRRRSAADIALIVDDFATNPRNRPLVAGPILYLNHPSLGPEYRMWAVRYWNELAKGGMV